MVRYANHDIVFREFPDEVALAINLSGCPNACPGCHSAYLQAAAGDELTPARLDALLDGLDGLITCVGFMGGDGARGYRGASIDRFAEVYGLVRRIVVVCQPASHRLHRHVVDSVLLEHESCDIRSR